MKIPKTAAEIYEEIKDFDMVLTSDGSLAAGINKLDNRSIGMLAYTPEKIANKYAIKVFETLMLEEDELVLKISKKLKKDIMSTHDAINKICDIEKHVDNVEIYLNDEEKLVYNYYKDLPTKNKFFQLFRREYGKKNIAVIEPDFFTHREKKILPERYKPIRVLTDKKKNFDNFHVFYSEENAIDKMLNLITKENENDIAIVLNFQEPVKHLIKTKLHERQRNINVKNLFEENLDVRLYLDFIFNSLYSFEASVRDFRHYTSLFHARIEAEANNFFLQKYAKKKADNEKLQKIVSLINTIEEKTYGYVLEQFQQNNIFKDTTIEVEKLRELLWKLELYNKEIEHSSLNEIFYYIKNFDMELKWNKIGVLLVNSKSSVHIDRPICFYFSPDTSWTKHVKSLDYIDTDKEENDNIAKFQILLNQGEERHYFTPLMKNGQKNLPCFYFNQIYQKEIKDFSTDIFSSIKHGTKTLRQEKEPEKRKEIPKKTAEMKVISQSALNSFVKCPKKYEFHDITKSEEKTFFLKGKLLHDYAEFYANYPDFCKEKKAEFFSDILLEEYMNIVSDSEKTLERTVFLLSIKNISAFIDTLTLIDREVDENKKIGSNFLAIRFNKTIKIKQTELWFENEKIKLKGKIDLVIDNTKIVDYKSSKKAEKPRKIIANTKIENIEDGNSNFQAISYLLELSTRTPNKPLAFYYYFFLENFKECINGENEIEQNLVKVEYYPGTYQEFITSDEGMNRLLLHKGTSKILNLLDQEEIKLILNEYPFEETEGWDDDKIGYKNLPAYQDILIRVLNIKNTQTNEKIVNDLFREMVRIKNGKSHTTKIVLFFEEDLRAFEKFLTEQLDLINEYQISKFPRKPVAKTLCDTCEYVDMCLGAE